METCETINGSWGYNITDNKYKSVEDLVHYIVNAAGRNTNFLLNVGPMPDGRIQQEFVDTLKAIGDWMNKYGETIYGTRGNIIEPQDWGMVTSKNKTLYVHLLNASGNQVVFLPGLALKITDAIQSSTKKKINFKQQAEGVFIYTEGLQPDKYDTVIELTTK